MTRYNRKILIPCEGMHIVAHVVPEEIFDSCLSEYSGSGDFFGMFSGKVLSTHEVYSGVDPTKMGYSVIATGGEEDETYSIDFRSTAETIGGQLPLVKGLVSSAGVAGNPDEQKVTLPSDCVLFVTKRVYKSGILMGDLGGLEIDEFDAGSLTIFSEIIPPDFVAAFLENDLLLDSDGHVVSQSVGRYSYGESMEWFVLEYSEYHESCSAYHRCGEEGWELDHMVEHSIA